ncbi:electron transfer flavoprotein regulatory factor 1 [Neocloeon triangulifer]|uniref:electron transfer flavoprotein regulatory factor 1 n=1 Tax=Neocloeon triangulifer TaxID=2078957 RepID=UPI00286F929F|nr:electron transfer flavoprotein regulatory factor 1 [Neocloeon triangulifer]
MALRTEVINLYKTLLHLGKDYPQGYEYFRQRLKTAFLKNKSETDPEKIKVMIARGNFVVKEIEALYMLRKYRTLKSRYYLEANKDKAMPAPGDNPSSYGYQ